MTANGVPRVIEAAIAVTPYQRVRVSLDLSGHEAFALADAIGEALSHVGNWRSDPRHLTGLRDALAYALGQNGETS